MKMDHFCLKINLNVLGKIVSLLQFTPVKNHWFLWKENKADRFEDNFCIWIFNCIFLLTVVNHILICHLKYFNTSACDLEAQYVKYKYTRNMILFTILRKRTYFILESNLKNKSIYVTPSVLTLVKNINILSNICFFDTMKSLDIFKDLHSRYSKVE